jgi:hypothetical protein
MRVPAHAVPNKRWLRDPLTADPASRATPAAALAGVVISLVAYSIKCPLPVLISRGIGTRLGGRSEHARAKRRSGTANIAVVTIL